MFMTSEWHRIFFFFLWMDFTCTFSPWGVTKRVHGKLMVLGRLKHIPLILSQWRGYCEESWETMHPFLPGLCSRMPSPLFMLTPTGAGAFLMRNADRSGFLRGCKHHHQRSGLQNWPKSDVGSMIVSQLSQLAVDSVLPQAQHILNTSSLENRSGQVMREPWSPCKDAWPLLEPWKTQDPSAWERIVCLI